MNLVKYQKGICLSTCVSIVLTWMWSDTLLSAGEYRGSIFPLSLPPAARIVCLTRESQHFSLSRAYTRCSAPFKAHFLHSFHGRAPVKAWISRMNPFSSTPVYPAKRNFYMLWLAYVCVCVCMCDLKMWRIHQAGVGQAFTAKVHHCSSQISAVTLLADVL